LPTLRRLLATQLPDLLLKDASFLFFALLLRRWLWCRRFHSRHRCPGFAAWRCAQLSFRAAYRVYGYLLSL